MTSQEIDQALKRSCDRDVDAPAALEFMLRTLLVHARDEARNNENAEAAFREQAGLNR